MQSSRESIRIASEYVYTCVDHHLSVSIAPLTDDGLDQDLRTIRTAQALDGPRPPQNPLARLMASAQGAILVEGTRTDAERIRKIRLTARKNMGLRRQSQLSAMFAR